MITPVWRGLGGHALGRRPARAAMLLGGGLRGPGSGGRGWRALGCARWLRERSTGAAASGPALQGFRRARRPQMGVRGGGGGGGEGWKVLDGVHHPNSNCSTIRCNTCCRRSRCHETPQTVQRSTRTPPAMVLLSLNLSLSHFGPEHWLAPPPRVTSQARLHLTGISSDLPKSRLTVLSA